MSTRVPRWRVEKVRVGGKPRFQVFRAAQGLGVFLRRRDAEANATHHAANEFWAEYRAWEMAP